MFSSVKSPLHMQAMRQALWLTLIFWCVLLISGISAIFLARAEFVAELQKELELQHQAILNLASKPNELHTFNQGTPSVLVGLKTTSETYGAQASRLFKQTGFFQIEHPRTNNPHSAEHWLVYSTDEPQGRLSVAMSFEELVNEPLEVFLQAFLVSGLAAALFGLIASLVIGLREQKRFKQISTQLQAIAKGDLKQRIPAPAKTDDLSNIASELNQTTAQLDTLIHQIKHLTASLAHDLKTPLARLRAELEVATTKEEKQATSPQQHILTLGSATAQVDNIITTFDAILSISRLQARAKHANKHNIPLATIVEQIYETYVDYAEDTQHHLHKLIKHQPIIQGDSALLAQLLANLVENALRYTPENSHITIETLKNGVQVYDDGLGIPTEEYERVLQPMYQIDQSRNEGSGLGLAMVKAIADFHEAELTLLEAYPNQHNKGLCIRIEFKQT